MRFSPILLALSLLVASCAQAPETKLAAPVTKLVLHSQLPESAPQTKLVKQFAQDAARRAAGRLQIDVVTDAPGDAWPRNVFALLQQGRADLVLGYVNTIGFREGQIGMLPGLVNSREQSLRFADTTLAQLLASRLEAQVRAKRLFWLWEKSVIASRGRPVRLPEDARNLGAVRAVGPYIDLFREIGAATTAVALSEVWTTMQRGLVSAAVVPAWMLAGAPATAADAVVVPDGDVGFYSLIAVAISPKSFDRLPPDLQRVLVESAAQAERAAPALLAQEDQLAAGAFASQGKSVVALDWRSFDAWIRLAREKTWIPVIGRMQTDERMIEALRQFVIGRSEKASP